MAAQITPGTAPPLATAARADHDVDDRLPLPDLVVPGRLLWPYAITIGLFHLAAQRRRTTKSCTSIS